MNAYESLLEVGIFPFNRRGINPNFFGFFDHQNMLMECYFKFKSNRKACNVLIFFE